MKRNIGMKKHVFAFALAAALAVTAWLSPASAQAAVLTDAAAAESVPKSLEAAEVKWAAQVGDPDAWMDGNYNAAATSPVQVGDTIYVLGNGKLTAVNAKNGAVLKTAAETLDSGYNYALCAGKVNGETWLFFQYCKSDPETFLVTVHVAAYDTDLNLRWSSEAAVAGSMGYCPLLVKDGVVYGMTASAGSDAEAFAIDAATGVYLWQTAIPFTAASQGSFTMSGSYCAGMTVVGDYVIGGSEGGTVYVFDKATGAVADRKDLFEDYRYNIRSKMNWKDGVLYFTTTDNVNSQEARIYAIPFDAAAGKLGHEKFSRITPTAVESVSTPEIYNGRIYVGCTQKDENGVREGAVAVLNAADLSLIYTIEIPGNEPGWDGSYNNKCTDVALAVDTSSQTVYGYVMYYDTPGAFVGFTDQAGQTAAKAFDVKTLMPEEAKNYSASSLIVGADGKIYFTNDSGYLVCVGSKVMMTEGEGSKVVADGKTELVFRSNAPIEEFQCVMVDGKVLDASCYTVSSGSTVVTLKAEYLATLSEGEHIISIVSESGTAEAAFTVTKENNSDGTNTKTNQPEDTISPKTGENNNLLMVMALIFAAGAALTGAVYCKRREDA